MNNYILEDKIFDALRKKYDSIFNEAYPSDLETIKRIARGQVRPAPRKTWSQLLRSLGIQTTERKVSVKGQISVVDPGQHGYVLIPEEIALKILTLGYLP